MSHSIRFTEQITISALHSLESLELNNIENEKLYGDCFRKHGHDYKFQIEMEAQINDESGLALDRNKLKEILEQQLTENFQAKFLNHHFDCTSGEALSLYLYKRLKTPLEANLKNVQLIGLHIQETRKNWFSYSNV